MSEIAWRCVNLKNCCLAGVRSSFKENKSIEMNKAHPLRMHSEKQEYFWSIFAHCSHPTAKVIRRLLGKPAQNNNNNISKTNSVQGIHNVFLKIHTPPNKKTRF